MPESFLNPYHFVPSIARNHVHDIEVEKLWPSDPATSPESQCVTHALYGADSHSGRILCRLVTETPIFIGNQRNKDEHPTPVSGFMLDSKPAIPASSLRGLISSVAEAASNSALRVLDSTPYSVRRPREQDKVLSAIGMIQIVKRANQTIYKLFPLALPTLEADSSGNAALPKMYQEMFPEPRLKVYVGNSDQIREQAFKYRTSQFTAGTSPKLDFYAMKLQRRTWSDGFVLKMDKFQYRKNGKYLLAQLATDDADPIESSNLQKDEVPHYTKGLMRVLGCWGDRKTQIPTGKHHELFLPNPGKWTSFDIVPEAIERFHALSDERTEHSINRDGPMLPFEPLDTLRNIDPKDPRFRLKNGDLVYFKPSSDGKTIAEISLSSIWRDYVRRDDDKPATAHDFFSKVDPDLVPFNPERNWVTPAEQIFGVAEEGIRTERRSALALSGRVRFSHGLLNEKAETNREELLLPSVPLKILDGPKPPSPALYFKPKSGVGGYIEKTQLKPGVHHPQGRKFYLHQQIERETRVGGLLPPWETRSPLVRTDQKSIIQPLRSKVEFFFHVDFDNLSGWELALLLYSLSPSSSFLHKIGMGKSLGLGSIRIVPEGVFEINRGGRYSAQGLFEPRYSDVTLAQGSNPTAWPEKYLREAHATKNPSSQSIESLRTSFRPEKNIHLALEALGNPANTVYKVNTPLVEGQDPEDKTFKWFVANDVGSGGRHGPSAQEDFLIPLPLKQGGLPTLKKPQWNGND